MLFKNLRLYMLFYIVFMVLLHVVPIWHLNSYVLTYRESSTEGIAKHVFELKTETVQVLKYVESEFSSAYRDDVVEGMLRAVQPFLILNALPKRCIDCVLLVDVLLTEICDFFELLIM